MNPENMNPDANSDLYPAGYLALVDNIANDLSDSCEDAPTEDEIEAYFDGLKADVIKRLNNG